MPGNSPTVQLLHVNRGMRLQLQPSPASWWVTTQTRHSLWIQRSPRNITSFSVAWWSVSVSVLEDTLWQNLTFCFQGEVCQIYDFMLWEMWWNISEICLFVKFNKKLICQCSIHPKYFVTSWLCHKTSRQHLCFDFDIGMVIYSAAERWREAPRRLERFHGAEWLCNTS